VDSGRHPQGRDELDHHAELTDLTDLTVARRGRLIVLEGPEGAGKTTQVRHLARYLAQAGRPHTVVREPGGTPAGEAIRAILLDPRGDVGARAEALLFLASRAELTERVIGPALERGDVVVADRFFLATYAYQVGGRGLPEADVRAANAFATGGLVPDLTVLLHLDPADGRARVAARGGPDRMERAGAAFHERVGRAFFGFLDPAWQRSHPECGPIAAVSGGGSEAEVFARILAALAERWPETFSLATDRDMV
jgi:dTMP kinase